MDPDAAALLDALQSCDYTGLYDRFSSFLLPFGHLIPLHSHNPNPPPAPRKRGPPKKKKPEPDPKALRPIAKQFLPFLCRAMKLLPALLRKSPKSSSNAEMDDGRAAELLAVHRLSLDCLACIGPCLAGKPYSVHLQRGRLVVCLEAWGRYGEAEEEALMLLEGLGSVLVEAAPVPKSRKGKIAGGSCFLPDPVLVGADDPEVTMLVIEVIMVLAGCAYKRKIRNEVAYDRILGLIDQVQPWLRFLDPESHQKYQNLLVNTLYKCSIFLVEEYTHFEGELVQRFCTRMLRECINSFHIDHFPSMVRKITSSINMQCAGASSILLGILRLTLESILCSCKVDLLKCVNEFLEAVSYIASSICVGNIDICRGAVKLLYEQGDAVLQVSPVVTSILTLYAAGLHFKFSNIQAKQNVDDFHSSHDVCVIMLFHDNGIDLRKLSVLLDNIASSFDISSYVTGMIFASEIKDSKVALAGASKSGKFDDCMHMHGKASLISYIDALEFLCKPIVECVSTAWNNLASEQEPILHSDTLNYVQKGLLQFCHLMLASSRHHDVSERVKQRINESKGTLLQVALAAFKISLLTGGSYQKSVLVIKCVISSTWIEPRELKLLISAISNVGAVCYNTGWLEKASKALQLCIEIIWTYVKLICGMNSCKSKGVHGDNTAEDGYKDAINDALTRTATIIDFLYKCGAKNIKEIIVKSLYELSAAEDIFHDRNGLLTLLTQWAKIMCKEFKDVDVVDNAPVLYPLLLDCHSTWSMNTISKILEQELIAYELMESRNPNLCRKMEFKIIDFLLNDVYTSKDYNLQRSRILVRKGRAFRAHGAEGLNNCLECLSQAIALLTGDPLRETASASHQLALTCILYAQCAQEANQDYNVIMNNVHCALNLLLSKNVHDHTSTNNHHEWGTTNILPLLCSIVDLLSLKGCLKFQIEICKVIIRFCMLENASLEKCISMLWINRRLNHSLCSSPIDEVFVMNISEQFGLNVNSLDYWIDCMKDHPPSLCMLLQKLLPSDFIFCEPVGNSLKRSFGAHISIEEVKKVASSLISEVPLTSQSALFAAFLYHDLSERLFTSGRTFEALLYAKEALSLRNKILRRKFSYTVAKQSAKSNPDGVTQSRSDHICLEAVSNAITEVWPDVSKSGNLDDPILSPWGVLRCYLESTLQVGIIHESAGNGAEAEYLFRTGKSISCLQGFPVFAIAFTMKLGQIYRRKQLWDWADNEFKYAKKLLVEYDDIISCDRCKMAFEVTIDMQVGDLSRHLFVKGVPIKSTASLSHALNLYRSALGKLELAEMESCISNCQKSEANDSLLRIDFTEGAGNEVQQTIKFCPPTKDEISSVCSICLSLNYHKGITYSGQVPEGPDEPSVLDVANEKSNTKQVKKISKKSSRFSAKDLNHQSKVRRNRSSSRITDVVHATSVEVDSNSNGSANLEVCPGTLSRGKLPMKNNGTSKVDCGGNEKCGCNKMECWQCFILQVIETGFMRNIIHLKWECHRRRLVLMLLLKIAKCLGTHIGKHGDHEVHEVFGQCMSVMFNRKSLKYCGMPDSSLIEHIVDETSGDFFHIERAALLYNMSWFSLKNIISEHPRITCCSLSKIQMATVFPWLLRSFILCQESPLLFKKVSQLLSSLFLLSSLDCSISLPVQTEKSLSLNHWAAYFHQASVGACLHCQYYSRNKTCGTKALEGFPNVSMTQNTAEISKFFRFAPAKIEDLEDCVTNFFKSLPNISILCISMLGGDYANLIGEMLLLPSFFPAWIVLTRMVANSQPVVMLLPVDLIQEDTQLERGSFGPKFTDSDTGSVKHWHCPWGYSVVDSVLPSFKQLLEENFLLLSNVTLAPADTQMKNANWWSQRTMLDNFLNKLLKSMENSWLGPWGCLLLGECSVPEHIEVLVHKLISALKSHGKIEINYSLIKAIIGGAKSVADAEMCIYQLMLYKGYFGRGACCGEERFRAFAATSHTELTTEFVRDLLKEALAAYAEQVEREPVIIVLDSDVQMLPWENLPILRSQEVYRMPSVGSIFLTFDKSCSHHKKDKAFGTIIPAVDPFNAYYLLNPSGDLNDTQVEFEQWFKSQEWEGKAGNTPTTKELVLALQNHDLFLYFGHGSGTQYIPDKEIQKLDHCAAALLMGCSSGSLLHRGCYAPQGAPLSYLLAGSPAVIANLWDVTDKDIDRFAKALLKSWLHEELDPLGNCTKDGQLVKQFSCMSIDSEVTLTSVRTRRKVNNGKLQNLPASSNWVCRRNRIVSFMSQARESCKLRMLIGASPVCYGVPTSIWKKSQS